MNVIKDIYSLFVNEPETVFKFSCLIIAILFTLFVMALIWIPSWFIIKVFSSLFIINMVIIAVSGIMWG